MTDLQNYKKVTSLIGLLTPEVIKQLLPSLIKSKRPFFFLPNLSITVTIDNVKTPQILIWNPLEFKYQKSQSSSPEKGWEYIGEDAWFKENPNQISIKGKTYPIPLFDDLKNQHKFMWNGHFIFSGDHARVYRKEKDDFKLEISYLNTRLYPFTFSSGRQVLLIDTTDFDRFNRQYSGKYCLNTSLKTEKIRFIDIHSTIRFLSPSYFISGELPLSEKPSNVTHIYKLVEWDDNKLDFYTTQTLQIKHENIISLSRFTVKNEETFLKCENNSAILYWKPKYSPHFVELEEVFTYSCSPGILPEIQVLECEWTHSEKRSIASLLPIENLPQVLLVEVLEFLV